MGKRTVIFRADGSPTIGMGHFIRSLALAEMLNQDFHCVFATRTPSKYQIDEINKTCHYLHDLPEDESHFPIFLNQLKGNEIVVLDNYYFDTSYQQAIKAKGCKLVCIDDIHNKHFVADIVINHAEGIDPQKYSREARTELLLGYKYALVRKEFRLSQKRNTNKKYSCLVMMGGADPFDVTSNILKTISHSDFDKPIAVVNGAAQKIEKNWTEDKIQFFEKLNASDVAELMTNSEFGILPASTVAIEACAVGLPFICGYFIDNQVQIYKGIHKKGLAVCAGEFNEITLEKWKQLLLQVNQTEVKSQILDLQRQIMDDRIESRYVNIFKKLLC